MNVLGFRAWCEYGLNECFYIIRKIIGVIMVSVVRLMLMLWNLLWVMLCLRMCVNRWLQCLIIFLWQYCVKLGKLFDLVISSLVRFEVGDLLISFYQFIRILCSSVLLVLLKLLIRVLFLVSVGIRFFCMMVLNSFFLLVKYRQIVFLDMLVVDVMFFRCVVVQLCVMNRFSVVVISFWGWVFLWCVQCLEEDLEF